MLYPRQSFQVVSNNQFILDTKPKNDDINLLKVSEIEQKLLLGVTLEEAKLFLDFMVYNSRIAFNYNNPVNVLDCSFYGQCGSMANLNRFLLKKIGLPYHQFNVGQVVCDDKALMHEVISLAIPIIINGEIVIKHFLLDPSFRQFFIKENCDISTYYGEKRGNIRKAAPDSGYFFLLSNPGKVLADSIIYNGYMEMTPENIKCYFDCFKFATIEKEAYSSEILLGKCYQTDISASQYFDIIDGIKEKYEFPIADHCEPYSYTATEIVNRHRNGLINRIRNFFGGNDSSSFNQEHIDKRHF